MLTMVQIKLAAQLLIAIKNKERTIFYSELGNRVAPPVFQRNVGRNIEEVSKVCYNLGLPLISAMVVSKSNKSAESGFYRLYTYLNIDTQGLSEYELFNLELKRIAECTEWYRLADYLEIEIDLPRPKANNKLTAESDLDNLQSPQIRILPMNMPLEFENYSNEGTKKQIVVNAYEHNPKARQECIRIHGTKCVICGFDFVSCYGKEFEGKIHVHHVKPLSEIDENYIVNPKTDLVPVCPNCHMVLHAGANGETYSIEEIRNMIKKNKNIITRLKQIRS